MLELEARITMNEQPLDTEGGRVVLHCDDKQARKLGFSQVEVILNAMTDEAMAPFPESRTDRARRRFKVTITDEGESPAADKVTDDAGQS